MGVSLIPKTARQRPSLCRLSRGGTIALATRRLFKELGVIFFRGLPLWGLDLYPARPRAGSIWRIAPLRYDPLQSRRGPPPARHWGRERQSCTPLNERLLAEIAPVQVKQIEAIDAHEHMSAPTHRRTDEDRLCLDWSGTCGTTTRYRAIGLGHQDDIGDRGSGTSGSVGGSAMNLDPQRVTAVRTLEALGYVYWDG